MMVFLIDFSHIFFFCQMAWSLVYSRYVSKDKLRSRRFCITSDSVLKNHRYPSCPLQEKVFKKSFPVSSSRSSYSEKITERGTRRSYNVITLSHVDYDSHKQACQVKSSWVSAVFCTLHSGVATSNICPIQMNRE